MRGGTGALSDQDSKEMHKSCRYQNNEEFMERERERAIHKCTHIHTHVIIILVYIIIIIKLI